MPRSLTSLLLLLVVAGLGFLGWRAFDSLRFDASLKVLLSGDRRSAASFGQVRRVVDDKALLTVLIEHHDVYSPEGQALLTELGDALLEIPGATEVVSLVHSIRPVRSEGFRLDPRDLIEHQRVMPRATLGRDRSVWGPWTTSRGWAETEAGGVDWDAVRTFSEWWPGARDLLVSADGHTANILLPVDRPLPDQAARLQLREDLRAAVEPFRARTNGILLFGFPLLEAEVLETVQGDLRVMLSLVAGLVLLILVLAFRSPVLIVAVLVLQGLGAGVLAAVLGAGDAGLNLYSAILFPLVLGLQLTFLTHLLASVQRQRAAGAGWGPAVRAALASVFGPSFTAAFTSVLGLLALQVCELQVVADFGLNGAIAVALIFVLVFGLALLIAQLPGSPARTQQDGLSRVEARLGSALARRLTRRRKLVLVLGAAFVLVLLPGALSIRADVRAAEHLNPDGASRAALRVLDEELGGLNTFMLEVDSGRPGGAFQRPALEFMRRLAAHATQVPHVTNVYSFAELLSAVNRIFNRDDPRAYHLPESDLLLATFAAAVQGRDYPLTDLLVDEEKRVTRFIVRTRDMPGERYIALLDDLMSYAREHQPEGVELIAREGVHSLIEADQRLVRSQLLSLATGGALVLLALMLLWRSFRRASLALLVNLPAMLSILALFGWAGLPLNSVTIMVGAVVLGVAVDDSIHLLAFYARELRLHPESPSRALELTLQRKLRPLGTTTAILLSGLGLLSFSDFPPVAHFGMAAALALAVSLAGVMLLLPALVSRAGSSAPHDATID
ncbi:MAG: membrane protein [Planctomycetota bacterium]|nr:MAG: membrane protein [Planctomycetota bacterium]